MPRKTTAPAGPVKTSSITVTVDTLTYAQELKAMLSREQGKVVKLDETVRLAMQEAIARRREAA
jgi:hypothetical protein